MMGYRCVFLRGFARENTHFCAQKRALVCQKASVSVPVRVWVREGSEISEESERVKE
jgi:hypothetical protein